MKTKIVYLIFLIFFTWLTKQFFIQERGCRDTLKFGSIVEAEIAEMPRRAGKIESNWTVKINDKFYNLRLPKYFYRNNVFNVGDKVEVYFYKGKVVHESYNANFFYWFSILSFGFPIYFLILLFRNDKVRTSSLPRRYVKRSRKYVKR